MTWPQGPNDPYGQQPGGYGQQQPGGYDPNSQPYSGQPYSADPYSGPPGYDPYTAQQGGYQQPGYQQPGFQQPGFQQPYQPRSTNTMAILSLVFAFVFAPLGIVFGHIAKKQIRERGDEGEGLATAGLVIGYILTALGVLGCAVDIIYAIWVASEVNKYNDYDNGTYTFILQSIKLALHP